MEPEIFRYTVAEAMGFLDVCSIRVFQQRSVPTANVLNNHLIMSCNKEFRCNRCNMLAHTTEKHKGQPLLNITEEKQKKSSVFTTYSVTDKSFKQF